MRKAIKAHRNLHTNEQNERTPVLINYIAVPFSYRSQTIEAVLAYVKSRFTVPQVSFNVVGSKLVSLNSSFPKAMVAPNKFFAESVK